VLIGEPASARLRLPKVSRNDGKRRRPEASRTSDCSRSTSVHSSPARSSAASSRRRLKAVLKELTEGEEQFVVFHRRAAQPGGRGKAEGSMDAGNMLKPMLARGELHVVGATTLDEYRKHVEKDAALERRFQPVYVGEPSVESTIAILRG
jgi:hypothetical protein